MFYLRLLLLHVKGDTNFAEISIVNVYYIVVSEKPAKDVESWQMAKNGCTFLQMHLDPVLGYSWK